MSTSTTKALLYCAVNGIANNTNGIGRQTKTFLAILARHHHRLSAHAGAFTPTSPSPSPARPPGATTRTTSATPVASSRASAAR